MQKKGTIRLQPAAQQKGWSPMTLRYVGSVGAVMQVKTGPTTDPGAGGVRKT